MSPHDHEPPTQLPSGDEPTSVPDDLTIAQDAHASIGGTARMADGFHSILLSHPTRRLGSGAATGEIPSAASRPAEPAPDDYELLAVIARGGMGEVWSARQVVLDRKVAIKRIHPRLLAQSSASELKEVLAQFESEAVVTARLEHPGIVPVHDLGVDASGLPMLAMKLVHGKNWGTLIAEDFRALSETEFLARHLPILLDVAQSVAFAHSRGVIHRDLKPTQVMIGEFGEVLLMDWGLAMLMDSAPPPGASAPPLPFRDLASNPTGTPAFMAPEQTERTSENIGPWTDVFLLGGILYLLLTGEAPYGGSDARRAFVEARDCLPLPAPERAPGRYMPHDLVAICERAMRKVPHDRYAAVQDIIGALQGYLAGEGKKAECRRLATEIETRLATRAEGYDALGAVQSMVDQATQLWPEHPALPALRERAGLAFARFALDSRDHAIARLQAGRLGDAAERARILAEIDAREAEAARQHRKMRLAVVGAMSLLLALLVSACGFVITLRDRNEAVERERDEAERQRALTMKQAQSTAELVDYMLADLRDSLNLERRSDRLLAEVIGEGVLEYYTTLKLDGSTPELQLANAGQMVQVGGRFTELGLHAEAEQVLRRAQEIVVSKLGADSVEAARNSLRLAQVLGKQGLNAEAMELATPALARLESPGVPQDLQLAAAWDAAGVVRSLAGDFAGARDLFARSLEIRRRMLPADDILVITTIINVAGIDEQTGNFDRARALYAEALAQLEASGESDKGAISQVYTSLGSFERNVGNWAAAEAALTRGLELAKQARGPEHADVAMVLNHLGALFLVQQRYADAEPFLLESLAIREKVLDPVHPDLGVTHANLAVLYHNTDRTEQARAAYLRAVEIYEGSLGEAHDLTASAYGNYGNFLGMIGEAEEGERNMLRAMELKKKTYGEDAPPVAMSYNNLAAFYFRQKRMDEVESLFLKSLAIRQKAYGEAHPDTAQSYNNLGVVYRTVGRTTESLSMLEKALESYRGAFGAEHPTTVGASEKVDAVRKQLAGS